MAAPAAAVSCSRSRSSLFVIATEFRLVEFSAWGGLSIGASKDHHTHRSAHRHHPRSISIAGIQTHLELPLQAGFCY